MTPGESIVVPLSCLAAKAPNGAMSVNGAVASTPARMLVDTGSCVTILSSKYADKLLQSHVNLNISHCPTPLHAVNDTPVPVVGQCSVPITIGNLSVVYSVIVADIGPDMLLGLDFLHSHGCTVDLEHNVLLAGGVPVPLKVVSNAHKGVYRVHIDQSVTIPPYSQVLVPGHIKSEHLPSSVGFVNPNKNFLETYSVAMAGVVAIPDNLGRVPLRLQNLLPTPTTISRHAEVAHVDFDISVDTESSVDLDRECGTTCNVVSEGQPPGNPSHLFDLQHLTAMIRPL